jgi:hypothetical protein
LKERDREFIEDVIEKDMKDKRKTKSKKASFI